MAELKKERNKLVISAAILACVLFSFYHFLAWNESRTGFIFNDPILALFEAKEVSAITFLFTYLFSITGIIICSLSPRLFIRLLQAYAIMTLIRMLSLFLLPLEPPAGIIPLKDVFLENTFYSGRDNLKDLFFSGHTAVLFLFAFLFREGWKKLLFIVGALAVGSLVMLQHVHYSIDVFLAPFAAYAAVWLQGRSNRFFAINK